MEPACHGLQSTDSLAGVAFQDCGSLGLHLRANERRTLPFHTSERHHAGHEAPTHKIPMALFFWGLIVNLILHRSVPAPICSLLMRQTHYLSADYTLMRRPASLTLDSRSLRALICRSRLSSRSTLQPPMGQGMAGVPVHLALLSGARIADQPGRLYPRYTNFTTIGRKSPNS